MNDTITSKSSSKKKTKRISFVSGDQTLFGYVIKDLGDETILKPTTPQVKRHLSMYPKGSGIGHHVTHEQYPQGHGRRHTQQEVADLLPLIRALLSLVENPDDSPPKLESIKDLASNTDFSNWVIRNFNRIVRPLSDAPIMIATGPIGDLIETMLDWKDGEMRFDIGDLLNGDNEITDEAQGAMISKITEKDMVSFSKRIGFSLDFSKMIVRLDSEKVIELSTEGVNSISKVFASELGLNGYVRSIERDE